VELHLNSQDKEELNCFVNILQIVTAGGSDVYQLEGRSLLEGRSFGFLEFGKPRDGILISFEPRQRGKGS